MRTRFGDRLDDVALMVLQALQLVFQALKPPPSSESFHHTHPAKVKKLRPPVGPDLGS